MEGDAVQALQAEVQLVKEQLCLLQLKDKMSERTKECTRGTKVYNIHDADRGTYKGTYNYKGTYKGI